MRLARFEARDGVHVGALRDGGAVSFAPLLESAGEPSLELLIREWPGRQTEFEDYLESSIWTYPLDEIKLLAPLTRPQKIVAIGSNYPRPGTAQPRQDSSPVLFFKPPSAIIGPSDPIRLPPEAELVIGEVELAIVVGKSGDRIDPVDGADHVFGYMVANDVTAPQILLGESAQNPLLLQQSRGKGFRTFCPIGPWIETAGAASFPAGVTLEQHVGDFLEISGNADDMLTPIPQLMTEVSRAFGLEAGDIILTGSPPPLSGKRTPLQPGAMLRSAIAGIGVLANPVIRE